METPKNSYPLSVELLVNVTHSVIPAKAGIQNPLNPALGGTGFRVALRSPGMTTSACFQEFCKRLLIQEKNLGLKADR
jgi:hypothetical protein